MKKNYFKPIVELTCLETSHDVLTTSPVDFGDSNDYDKVIVWSNNWEIV